MWVSGSMMRPIRSRQLHGSGGGQAVTGVDASLATETSISGVVTDSVGAPLQGVWVSVRPVASVHTRGPMGRIGSVG